MLDILNILNNAPIELVVGGVIAIGMWGMFLYIVLHPRHHNYYDDNFRF